MNRMVLGALAALMMVAAGLFWWQGRAELARSAPPPDLAANPPGNDAPIELPSADPHARGAALPHAARTTLSKEQKRFNRYDRNRDGQVTRTEMLSTRVKAFEKLDLNHDNMLSFEEWAVKTSDRFREIDTNHDGVITPVELAAFDAAAQAKRAGRKPTARCADDADRHGKGGPPGADADSAGADADADGGQPAR